MVANDLGAADGVIDGEGEVDQWAAVDGDAAVVRRREHRGERPKLPDRGIVFDRRNIVVDQWPRKAVMIGREGGEHENHAGEEHVRVAGGESG